MLYSVTYKVSETRNATRLFRSMLDANAFARTVKLVDAITAVFP